jgi:hypothetical protein
MGCIPKIATRPRSMRMLFPPWRRERKTRTRAVRIHMVK